MITAYWKELPNGNYECTSCRIRTPHFYETCPMCDAIMSNYESLLLRVNHLTEDQIYDILSIESEGK